jgi:hypothetical protein
MRGVLRVAGILEVPPMLMKLPTAVAGEVMAYLPEHTVSAIVQASRAHHGASRRWPRAYVAPYSRFYYAPNPAALVPPGATPVGDPSWAYQVSVEHMEDGLRMSDRTASAWTALEAALRRGDVVRSINFTYSRHASFLTRREWHHEHLPGRLVDAMISHGQGSLRSISILDAHADSDCEAALHAALADPSILTSLTRLEIRRYPDVPTNESLRAVLATRRLQLADLSLPDASWLQPGDGHKAVDFPALRVLNVDACRDTMTTLEAIGSTSLANVHHLTLRRIGFRSRLQLVYLLTGIEVLPRLRRLSMEWDDASAVYSDARDAYGKMEATVAGLAVPSCPFSRFADAEFRLRDLDPRASSRQAAYAWTLTGFAERRRFAIDRGNPAYAVKWFEAAHAFIDTLVGSASEVPPTRHRPLELHLHVSNGGRDFGQSFFRHAPPLRLAEFVLRDSRRCGEPERSKQRVIAAWRRECEQAERRFAQYVFSLQFPTRQLSLCVDLPADFLNLHTMPLEDATFASTIPDDEPTLGASER